jgi:hypothetical protein
LSLAPGYDSNIDFLPEGPGDAVFASWGGLALVARSPRGQLRIRGVGRGFVYADQDTRNRADANVGVDGSRQLSPSTTMGGYVTAELGHTDRNSVLADQGVLLPLSRTRTASASANLDWRPGTRNSTRIGGRAYYTDFESPELVDSRSVRGFFTLGRRFSEHDRLAAEYAIEHAWLSSSYLTHFGSFLWDRVLSQRSALLFEGGVSYTGDAAAAGLASAWNFYGGVSFARSVGRSSLVLFARREVTPVFGLGGLQVANRFGMRAMIPMGRVWSLDLMGTHVQRSVPEGYTGDQASSDEAFLALQRTLGRQLALAGEARYRYRSPDGPIPRIQSVEAVFVLSFFSPQTGGASTPDWRR